MESSAVRHLSIRVPWHDTGWEGRICAAPSANASCLALRRIHETRVDGEEDEVAGADWDELPAAKLPPCVRETRGVHAQSGVHDHAHAPVRIARHSGSRAVGALAAAVPRIFRAVRARFAGCFARRPRRSRASRDLDYRPELEDEADELIPFDVGLDSARRQPARHARRVLRERRRLRADLLLRQARAA